MTAAEEERNKHSSNFLHPEIQTLALVEDAGHGTEDGDYCGDLPSRTEQQHRGEFLINKLRMRQNSAANVARCYTEQ